MYVAMFLLRIYVEPITQQCRKSVPPFLCTSYIDEVWAPESHLLRHYFDIALVAGQTGQYKNFCPAVAFDPPMQGVTYITYHCIDSIEISLTNFFINIQDTKQKISKLLAIEEEERKTQQDPSSSSKVNTDDSVDTTQGN